MDKDPVQERVAIYLRDFTGAGHDEQLELCMEYGRLNFQAKNESFDVYRDSGTLGDDALPGWNLLSVQLRAGGISAVICPELSAVCRGAADFIRLSGEFNLLGIPLIFVKEGLETDMPSGRVLLYAAELFVNLERSSAAAVIRDGMRSLARTGKWLGGVTPTGYASARSGSAPGQGGYMLELIPEQADTVKLIFSLFRKHDSLSTVTGILRDLGVNTKNGRAFSRFTIRQMLENPVYLKADRNAYAYFSHLGAEICSDMGEFDGERGMMVYNKTLQKQGQTTRQRDPEEWIVAVGAHPGLIGSDDWIAVQHSLGDNKSRSTRRPKGDHGLLAGLLVCADCGSSMRPKLSSRQNADGDAVFFYLCEFKERSHLTECDMPNLSGNAADSAIASLLRGLSPDTDGLLPSRPKPPISPEAIAEHNARLSDLKNWISENEADISKLVFTLIKAIDKAAYDEIIRQIDTLRSQNESLKAQVEALESLTAGHPVDIVVRDGLPALLQEWNSRFDDLTVAQKRAALRCLIKQVDWDGTFMTVEFLGGATFELEPL